MKTDSLIGCLLLTACLLPSSAALAAETASHCDPGNGCSRHPASRSTCPSMDIGGITLPQGFCATVFADKLGTARQLTVAPDGDVYVALLSPEHGGGIVALRPGADGRAAETRYFGKDGGTGIGIYAGYLYFATPTEVLRYKLRPGQLLPDPTPETVIAGFPKQQEHEAKTFALDGAGHIFVNVGAPSNACQRQDRAAGSPGIRPCPYLSEHGGIWEFSADKLNQRFPQDGERYATGIRNAVAITWNVAANGLYVVQMGRDQLNGNWPKLFTPQQSALLPAEEFMRVQRGQNYGWPYCYYDQIQHQKVLAPEYGGDGRKIGECNEYAKPIVAFPGHWAPEALSFYSGDAFPPRYRGGAFIAFHGSWNRAPEPQAGYQVEFVPFKAGRPSGNYETFAGGFAGSQRLMSPGAARYRPNGVAEAPDGALYISDSQQGRIWRVSYRAD